jgi:hypothetical protein
MAHAGFLGMKCGIALSLVLTLVCAPRVGGTPVTQTIGPWNCTFYNNGDTDGTQTGQQDWSAQQKADVAASLGIWANRIADVSVRQLELHLFWYNFAGGTLGSSYNPIWGDGTTAWSQTELVWREAYNPGASTDARIVYDTDAAGYSWNFGAGAPGAGQIDFRSVITHEVGHCVGFLHTYQAGSDTFWSGGLTEMSKYFRDDAGNRPKPGTTGTPGNFNQSDNPVWFDGPHAMAANGGNPVAIYAPATYAAGSSLSHVNEATYWDDLMSPFIGLGQSPRTPSALDWAMLEDFGWTLNAVPAPGAAAASVLLFAVVGLTVVRRRS